MSANRKEGLGRSTAKVRKAAVLLSCQDAFQFLKDMKPGSADLIVSSPPYFIGKEYDKSKSISDFKLLHADLLPLLIRALKPGGSLCWQVGNHVENGVVTPLDAIVYPIFSSHSDLLLRNRIVWTFGHGVHASRRFSGRHETILWFTNGLNYKFDLDAVRVPQKYPGKRYYKGPKRGEWSGNPLGKNPSDVWEIPNVNAGHVEKTEHPCQFPVALVQRLIRALVPPSGLVVDPFVGSGSSAVAAILEGCRFAGSDSNRRYVQLARTRADQAIAGKVNYRPLEKRIHAPTGKESVAMRPPHFAVQIS